MIDSQTGVRPLSCSSSGTPGLNVGSDEASSSGPRGLNSTAWYLTRGSMGTR